MLSEQHLETISSALSAHGFTSSEFDVATLDSKTLEIHWNGNREFHFVVVAPSDSQIAVMRWPGLGGAYGSGDSASDLPDLKNRIASWLEDLKVRAK